MVEESGEGLATNKHEQNKILIKELTYKKKNLKGVNKEVLNYK